MRVNNINKLFLLITILTMLCMIITNCGQNMYNNKDDNTISSTSVISEELPIQRVIPNDIKLWCLEDHNIPRRNFGQYTRWYKEEGDNKQIFKLYEGDWCYRGNGSKHSRLEVHSGLSFSPGNTWYKFQATYKINTTVSGGIAIAQMFDYREVHPQIMFHFWEGNRVTFQPRGEGRRELGTGYNNRPFTIMMRSNGRREEVYFNGERVYEGPCANDTANAVNGFRWGLYYGNVMPSDTTSIVTDVYRGVDNGTSNTAPSVSITQPAASTFDAGANIKVVANATDSDGSISNVKLYLNNSLIRQENVAPYEWNQNGQDSALNNLSAGTYTLKVVATDDDGATKAATKTITVGNNAPNVSITQPAASTFNTGATIIVVADASDSDGSISNVKLYLNNSLVRQENVAPYEWNHNGQDPALSNLSAGTYTLKVVAADDRGATKTATKTITVGESTPVGPAGYTYCCDEGQSYTFNQTVDVAYGANGSFNYKTGVTGTITFNNDTFGDPIYGVVKAGFYKIAAGGNVTVLTNNDKDKEYTVNGIREFQIPTGDGAVIQVLKPWQSNVQVSINGGAYQSTSEDWGGEFNAPANSNVNVKVKTTSSLKIKFNWW